jgi:hypothetical protein
MLIPEKRINDCNTFQTARLPAFQTSSLPDCKTARLQDCKTARLFIPLPGLI